MGIVSVNFRSREKSETKMALRLLCIASVLLFIVVEINGVFPVCENTSLRCREESLVCNSQTITKAGLRCLKMKKYCWVTKNGKVKMNNAEKALKLKVDAKLAFKRCLEKKKLAKCKCVFKFGIN